MFLEIHRPVFDTLPILVTAVLLAVSLYTDLRYGKIYNKFTLPAMVVGVMLNVAGDGWRGLFESTAGILLVLVPFLLFAPFAKIGGGDAKLMMAVGSLLGIKLAVWALLYSAVAGGILALIVMARYKAMLSTTRKMLGNLYLSAVLGSAVELSSGSRGIRFRYTPAITIGTLVACFLRPM